MRNSYFEYLKSLTKEELIKLIYKPYIRSKKIESFFYRNIALKISYDGEKYEGLAEYKFGNTIGNYIKNSLLMTTLGSEIIYAGRTDKGVSAVGMIASLTVKSLLPNSCNRNFLIDDDKNELNYQKLLNNYLPQDIKITAWAPVDNNFNARFTCVQRRYRYYFKNNNYDLQAMQKMCDYILKLKNFYNFSKHSDENARYVRTIQKCEIVKDGELFYLDIRARSFLHNMIRKIYWAIEKAGRGETFDFKKIGTADSLNLVFYDAVYPENLQFKVNKVSFKTLEKLYGKCIIKHKINKLIFESQF